MAAGLANWLRAPAAQLGQTLTSIFFDIGMRELRRGNVEARGEKDGARKKKFSQAKKKKCIIFLGFFSPSWPWPMGVIWEFMTHDRWLVRQLAHSNPV